MDLRIVAIIKTFRGDEFAVASLESIYHHMTKIVYVHSNVSWTGQKGNTVAPLIEAWKKQYDVADKIVNLYFDSADQNAQYQHALEYAKKHCQYDYKLLIDTDEVWDRQSIAAAIEHAAAHPERDGWYVNMHTYIKSPFYRIEPIDRCKPAVLIKKGLGINGVRGVMTPNSELLPHPIVMHHFCAVRKSLSLVWEKHTNSCSTEAEPMVPKEFWVKNVWNKLPNAEDLLPLKRHRSAWKRVRQVTLDELPEALRGDPFTLAFLNYPYKVYGKPDVQQQTAESMEFGPGHPDWTRKPFMRKKWLQAHNLPAE